MEEIEEGRQVSLNPEAFVGQKWHLSRCTQPFGLLPDDDFLSSVADELSLALGLSKKGQGSVVFKALPAHLFSNSLPPGSACIYYLTASRNHAMMRDSAPTLSTDQMSLLLLGFSSSETHNSPEFLLLHTTNNPEITKLTNTFFERKFDCSIEPLSNLNSDSLWNLARRWCENEENESDPRRIVDSDLTAIFTPISAAHITGIENITIGVPVTALWERISSNSQNQEPKINVEDELYSRGSKRRRENEDNSVDKNQKGQEEEDEELVPGKEMKEAFSGFSKEALGLVLEKMDLKEIRTAPATLNEDGSVVFASLEDIIPVLESIAEEILFPYASRSFL